MNPKIKISLEQWHEFTLSPNPKLISDILSDAVVFHSPVVHTPQKGKQITAMYLTAAASVLKNFSYQKEIVSDKYVVLEFTATIDDVTVNGIDIISFDELGKISEFKVMVRPLQAVNKIHEKMKIMLESIGK